MVLRLTPLDTPDLSMLPTLVFLPNQSERKMLSIWR